MMSEQQDKIIRFLHVSLILILGFMFISVVVSGIYYNIRINNEINFNNETYGLKITNEELKCYNICDGDYFYKRSSRYVQTLCVCGVDKNEDKLH